MCLFWFWDIYIPSQCGFKVFLHVTAVVFTLLSDKGERSGDANNRTWVFDCTWLSSLTVCAAHIWNSGCVSVKGQGSSLCLIQSSALTAGYDNILQWLHLLDRLDNGKGPENVLSTYKLILNEEEEREGPFKVKWRVQRSENQRGAWESLQPQGKFKTTVQTSTKSLNKTLHALNISTGSTWHR